MQKAFLLAGTVLFLIVKAAVAQQTGTSQQTRPRARELGIQPGVFEPGPLNAITDVPGVRVGQVSVVARDNVRTGVTAIVPHPGNLFREKVAAAVHVSNAFGKFVGSTQVEELGQLETPILLTMDGVPVWRELQPPGEREGGDSCLIVVATDAPLDARQLRRLAVRAIHGMARTGSSGSHSSGDYVIVFSTANRVVSASAVAPAAPASALLREDELSPLFQAVIEATEEAIINSLLRATTVQGRDGHTAQAIPIEKLRELLRRYGRQ